MPAPAFEFTSRATPIVQMGRSSRLDTGNEWQTGLWGSGLWGVRDWEVAWTDLTCEIHEITTDTGRGGATDRFRPGTAEIVASNLNQVSELIFPPVPDTGEGFEFVPQPPITNEEELQAPTATTVISNGWSFTDDFETAPPRWVFPAQFATTGAYPTRPMVWHDGYVSPEMYADASAENYQAHGAIQWTGLYPDFAELAVTVDAFSWPSEPAGGTPRIVVELYAHGNTVDRSCNCARITLTPVFGGDNTGTVQIFRMTADGSATGGGTSTITAPGLGTDGQFPALTFTMSTNPEFDMVSGGVTGVEVFTLSLGSSFVDGGRTGFAVHYVEGDIPAGTSRGAPKVTRFEGFDFDDDFSRPTGSGWTLVPKIGFDPMIMEAGSMRPPMTFDAHAAYGGDYRGESSAQWVSSFAGDQFIEVDLAGMSKTVELEGTVETFLTLRVKGNRWDRTAVVVEADYLYGGATTEIYWEMRQENARGQSVYFPNVEDESYGTISQPFGDPWPEPSTWRVEADTSGEVRLYYQRALLGHAVFPDIPDGDRIGLTLMAGAGQPAPGDIRPMGTRLERVSGGLQEPLGTEELGTWVRIGVDHDTLGQHWFFRGFVDAVVPTYHPEHQDAVRIECVDSLGEAGRVFVDGDQLSHRFNSAPNRIRQILHRAHWPRRLRTIHDDSTQLSRPSPGKAVDLLTHVAESCGGAVYGDPNTGDVVFKGMDWQGVSASEEPEAFITNYRPAVDDGVPRVCPVGWERSSRRSDMYTRVRYQTETSETVDGDPIIKEWREPQAERIYGVELYERTLLCITAERLNELAIRQLRLRHPNQFPRIEAVLLDAATEDAALDLMTTATFTRPSKYWCQLRRNSEFVFNRKMLVTGVRHRMQPTRWTCRLTLDPSSVFYETGSRWGEGRWGRDEWGRSR